MNPPQVKSDKLSYNRVPFSAYKDVTPRAPRAKRAYPKGTVIGTPAAVTSTQLKKVMGAKAYNAIPGYKKGGKVKKTGIAKVHKGERVLTKKQTKKFDQKKFNRVRKQHFGL